MMADELLNAQDLITAKKHDTFHSEVITGKTGGLSTGANIDYATNAVTGQVQDTLPHVLSKVGFVPAGFDFSTGGTLTERNKSVYYQTDGNWYHWAGTLPKTIPAASTPASTGGISPSAWNVSTSAFMYRDWQGFTDALLAEAGIVDDGQPDTVGDSQRVDAISTISTFGISYQDVRTYTGNAKAIKCSGRDDLKFGAGTFVLDTVDTTSIDDDGTVLVDILGRRWKRQYSGAVDVTWFGASPGDDTQSQATKNKNAFRSATLSMKSAWDAWKAGKRSRSVYVPAGDYNLSNGFCVPKGCAIYSDGLGVARIKILGATADASNVLPLVSLGRVINDSTNETEVSSGAYVQDPPPSIDRLYLNPQNSNVAVDVNGIPGFSIGTIWIQANIGVSITGGSGDGVIDTIFAEDSTGTGVDIGNCQNVIVKSLYTFVCKNPVVYSGNSNNTIINTLQANYTMIAVVTTSDDANINGARIGTLVAKQNQQYPTFTSVMRLRSASCDLSVGDMDARNYNGYAIHNENGLNNVVKIDRLTLRQAPFASSDTAGTQAAGCRVNNMSLTVNSVDIDGIQSSPFELAGTFIAKVVVNGGVIKSLATLVPVCNITNTSGISYAELQVEPPAGLALFNLQDVISPRYDRVRNPFPMVNEGGRNAIKIPYTGNANSWSVAIVANTNPSGNAQYRRVRRYFVCHEVGYTTQIVTAVGGISDGNTGLSTVYTPDVTTQFDIDTVGAGASKPFATSGYVVISLPSSYADVKFSVEQLWSRYN